MPKQPTEPKVKYGVKFPSEFTDLDIEFACIQHGGRWQMIAESSPLPNYATVYGLRRSWTVADRRLNTLEM